MFNGSSIGLRSRFMLIGIAVLVPLVLVMLHLATYERETALANAERRVGLFASLTAERQYLQVQRARIVLSEIANDRRALGEREGCIEFLAAALARHAWMTGIRISALDGSGLCAAPPEISKLDIADRAYFKSVVAGEAFAVSASLNSRKGDRNPIIGMAGPVRNDAGQAIRVLSAAIRLEALSDFLPVELTHDPGVVVDVIDGNGNLLARHPEDLKLVGQPDPDKPVVERALREPGGSAELHDLKGTLRLFAFQRVRGVDWVVAVGISRAAVVGPIDAALRQRLGLIVAIVLGSCVIGLVGGEILVFWPMRALARTAQALERGDLGARPRLTGLGEVGDLERSLNRMAEAIQQRESDLKQSQAVSEQALRSAEAANEARSRVLASMSHEIRTPLGGIVGYNDLLLAQKLKPEQRRFAERIEVAAASAVAVIDSILDIARIEAREVEIEQRPFSLPSLVDNAISMVRASAERKGLVLTVELDPELPPAVLGDETRLRQVLLNLLANAIKFTTSGSVTLRVEGAGRAGRVSFSILDTGIGIDEAQHHRLFKRFSQAHDAIGRDYGGTGLGLAISKELTELMGGQLGFSSTPDQGSTFRLELALPQADASRIETRPAPVQSTRAGRILLADDHEMSREITSAMLTMAGHEVDSVVDGAQAVAAIRQKAYDLVLMDIEMRGMNGIAAIAQIRQLDSAARHVPVIAMTAHVLSQQVRAFMAAGMDDHLAKPFTRNQLISKVNLFLWPPPAVPGSVAILSGRAAAFDENVLTQMKILLGDQRTAAWVDTLRSQLEAIVSIDNKAINRHKLARTAHTLVSQAGSLGFTRLSKLSSELEQACAQRADYRAALGQVRKASRGALNRIERIQNSDTFQLSEAS